MIPNSNPKPNPNTAHPDSQSTSSIFITLYPKVLPELPILTPAPHKLPWPRGAPLPAQCEKAALSPSRQTVTQKMIYMSTAKNYPWGRSITAEKQQGKPFLACPKATNKRGKSHSAGEDPEPSSAPGTEAGQGARCYETACLERIPLLSATKPLGQGQSRHANEHKHVSGQVYLPWWLHTPTDGHTGRENIP